MSRLPGPATVAHAKPSIYPRPLRTRSFVALARALDRVPAFSVEFVAVTLVALVVAAGAVAGGPVVALVAAAGGVASQLPVLVVPFHTFLLAPEKHNVCFELCILEWEGITKLYFRVCSRAFA